MLWLFLSGCVAPRNDNSYTSTWTNTLEASWAVDTLSDEQVSSLQYLIQEEKLARDVYLEMYKLRGHKKFYNIINSEENHQAQVARLLEIYAIDNPIQEMDSWVFKDSEFKNLYDKFIAKGGVSVAEAFQAWVDIEKMDIEDIEKIMPLFANNNSVQQVLTSLLEWSKRHLVAFSK